MLKNKIDYQIVLSVNDTAYVAGIQTIAEFVEDDETLDTLKDLGLDYAQSYALNKPETLIKLLESMRKT